MEAAELLAVLDLETLDLDLFRAMTAPGEDHSLYGGQVAAQAVIAAGRTVPPGRDLHSLHGYFLRPGRPEQRTVFRVERDRDGRSFSARRVVAIQDQVTIFSAAMSFQARDRDGGGPDFEVEPIGLSEGPDAGLPGDHYPRLRSMECRAVPGPYPAEWPTRYWARTTFAMPDDPLLHASVMTYLSDMGSGLATFHSSRHFTGPSLDHVVWFHRPARLDSWVLVDFVPLAVTGGRGLYRGTVRGTDGNLLATTAQEQLFVRRSRS